MAGAQYHVSILPSVHHSIHCVHKSVQPPHTPLRTLCADKCTTTVYTIAYTVCRQVYNHRIHHRVHCVQTSVQPLCAPLHTLCADKCTTTAYTILRTVHHSVHCVHTSVQPPRTPFYALYTSHTELCIDGTRASGLGEGSVLHGNHRFTGVTGHEGGV